MYDYSKIIKILFDIFSTNLVNDTSKFKLDFFFFFSKMYYLISDKFSK